MLSVHTNTFPLFFRFPDAEKAVQLMNTLTPHLQAASCPIIPALPAFLSTLLELTGSDTCPVARLIPTTDEYDCKEELTS